MFSNPSSVFSYQLATGNSRSGVFEHYVHGLHARQQAIATACESFPEGIVHYTDIKKFYPSISSDIALKAWKKYSDIAKLPHHFHALGERLLDDHQRAGRLHGGSVLTGPMISHLIGNLVLRELDEEFSRELPARYFRYVDDVTLVGEREAVHRSVSRIRERFLDLGFYLHEDDSPKNLEVPVSEWLQARHDFQQSRRALSWMTLVGDLKRFLLLWPELTGALRAAFRNEGFRVPVRQYGSAATERDFMEKLIWLAQRRWFRRKVRKVTIGSLVADAHALRTTYESEFLDLLGELASSTAFSRKRIIPKLRYRAGRLTYLAPQDALASLAEMAARVPELRFHAEVMTAVASGNIDSVLELGTNAAQAAAQPLRAAGAHCRLSQGLLSDVAHQALAVFLFNGVDIEPMPRESQHASPLTRFAVNGADRELMRSPDPFVRELACLHGLSPQVRHPELLECAFDDDEELALDAIDQLQQSGSA